MMMTRGDIAAVLGRFPELNYAGMGLFERGRSLTESQRREELQAGRDRLLERAEMCSRCCRWLSDVTRTRAVNRRRTSYEWKELAEGKVGYVTNGAFIAAALHLGFPVETDSDSLNVLIGISERSYRAAKAELELGEARA